MACVDKFTQQVSDSRPNVLKLNILEKLKDKFTEQVSDSRPTVLKLNILEKLKISKVGRVSIESNGKRPGYISCVCEPF